MLAKTIQFQQYTAKLTRTWEGSSKGEKVHEIELIQQGAERTFLAIKFHEAITWVPPFK